MAALTDLGREFGALASRALDLALPATCAGCQREGAALCVDCLPALDARLDRAPGTVIGLPATCPNRSPRSSGARPSAALRGGPSTGSSTPATGGSQIRWAGRWAGAGHGRAPAERSSSRSRRPRIGFAIAATTRPSSLPAPPAGCATCPSRRSSSGRGRRRPSSISTGAPGQATSPVRSGCVATAAGRVVRFPRSRPNPGDRPGWGLDRPRRRRPHDGQHPRRLCPRPARRGSARRLRGHGRPRALRNPGRAASAGSPRARPARARRVRGASVRRWPGTILGPRTRQPGSGRSIG